jgi:hypothetical protein
MSKVILRTEDRCSIRQVPPEGDYEWCMKQV